MSRSAVLAAAVASLGVGLVAGSAVLPAGASDRIEGGPSRRADVVFLSHVNTETMPIFPGDPTPVIDPVATVAEDGYYLQSVTIGEHSGTHWGAPCHFNEGEACADDLDAEDFVRPVAVIDVRAQVAANPDYALSISDVKSFERRHGKIRRDSIVIAWTGWDQYWDDPVAYFNADADGVMHYPGIAGDTTRWLIARRNIGGLGIDTHGVDPGSDDTYETNTTLLHGDRIHLENLTGLEQMPANGGFVVVGGVRNENGSGSPATIFGFTR